MESKSTGSFSALTMAHVTFVLTSHTLSQLSCHGSSLTAGQIFQMSTHRWDMERSTGA